MGHRVRRIRRILYWAWLYPLGPLLSAPGTQGHGADGRQEAEEPVFATAPMLPDFGNVPIESLDRSLGAALGAGHPEEINAAFARIAAYVKQNPWLIGGADEDYPDLETPAYRSEKLKEKARLGLLKAWKNMLPHLQLGARSELSALLAKMLEQPSNRHPFRLEDREIAVKNKVHEEIQHLMKLVGGS